MKKYTMFYYPFLFSDHMAKVSNQAKLYYIALNFYAINGFVSNPLQILDSFGYDKSVLEELIKAEEVLKLEDRDEIFITSYFVHNRGLNPMSWLSTPFAIYWKGKLFIKKDNGVATFTPQGDESKREKKVNDPLDSLQQPSDVEAEWDTLLSQIKN